MAQLSNPYRFQKLATVLLRPLVVVTAVGLGFGVVWALYLSPPDYQQGEAVRIMYIHVPAAYNALIAYCLMAVASAIYLIFRHPLADICARAAALPGLVFTAICLMSGSLWGRPIWGTWWAWDARMTSVLILFFLYLGYISLTQAFGDSEKARRPAAILACIGAVNLPVIKFSVDWWHSLHQPASLIRLGGSALDNSMLYPLLVMLASWQLWLGVLVLMRMQSLLLHRKINRGSLFYG